MRLIEMKSKSILCICLLFVMLATSAQQKPHRFLSKTEFRARQEAYLKEKAQLTDEEASLFLPVYFEMQDKKHEINETVMRRARHHFRSGNNKPDFTDEEYLQMIEENVDARLRNAQLDKEYLKKSLKIISAEKVFRIQQAEVEFHRYLLRTVHRPK